MKTAHAGVGLVLATALLSSTAAAAATDLENFQARIGKSAPSTSSFPDKPKATCVCQDPSVDTTFPRAGVLVQFVPQPGNNFVEVSCKTPTFDPTTGAQNGFQTCFPFVALPK